MTALFDVTSVLAARLAVAIGGPVYVGPPVAKEVGTNKLVLFPFHIVPNRDLRNATYLVEPGADPLSPLIEADALPVDVRYLISVFRSGGGQADASELLVLGHAIQELHRNPTITEADVPDQRVRLTPEPYPMEEMSRVWGLFPETSYRTSMVYLASPVYISLDPDQPGPPVLERTTKSGPFVDPPDVFGDGRVNEVLS